MSKDDYIRSLADSISSSRIHNNVDLRFVIYIRDIDPLCCILPLLFRYLQLYPGENDISISSMAILLPVSMVILNIGMPISNLKVFVFDHRITALITVCGISMTIFFLSFCNRFIFYILIYGFLFGLFIGYGYLAPIKNCYEHIPTRKGLCSGVCIFGFGISALLFNFLLLKLINP